MAEVRRLIVGGLEQEVVVGHFLPADGLEDSDEINESDLKEMDLLLIAVSIQSWNSASSFDFTWGEGALRIRVSFFSTRTLNAVSDPEVRSDHGYHKSFAHRSQGPRRLSSVCQRGEGKLTRYRMRLHSLPSQKAKSIRI